MGTTANYSWPTPVATDLVKDGWEAIKDLGDAADTTVKAVSDAQGLIHINTTSFTASSSETITAFSADYDNYLVQIYLTSSSASNATLNCRLGLNGTPDTGSNYAYANLGLSVGGTGTNTSSTNTTSFLINSIDSTLETSVRFDVLSPFLSQRTQNIGGAYWKTSTSQGAYAFSQRHNLQNSYNQIVIFPSSGNMTGSISVYGYKK